MLRRLKGAGSGLSLADRSLLLKGNAPKGLCHDSAAAPKRDPEVNAQREVSPESSDSAERGSMPIAAAIGWRGSLSYLSILLISCNTPFHLSDFLSLLLYFRLLHHPVQ